MRASSAVPNINPSQLIDVFLMVNWWKHFMSSQRVHDQKKILREIRVCNFGEKKLFGELDIREKYIFVKNKKGFSWQYIQVHPYQLSA